MIVPDINVWVAVARADSERHVVSIEWLNRMRRDKSFLALLPETLVGYLRVMTMPYWKIRVSGAEAFRFIDALIAEGRTEIVRPSNEQMRKFRRLIEATEPRLNSINDAWLAAATMELDATLVTWDEGFGQYPGLVWQLPTDPQPRANSR